MIDSSFYLHLQQQVQMQQIMQAKVPMHKTIIELVASILSVMSSTKSIDWVRRSIIGYRKQIAAQGRLGSTCRMQLIARKAIHNLQKENGGLLILVRFLLFSGHGYKFCSDVHQICCVV